jgi:glycosyltransferase involved in cell wall biosynthesis
VTEAGSRRLPISIAIVARDEEADLPGAIRSVPFAAEAVVVVDARTSDRTREVARALDAPDRPVRVIDREWAGHVAQKNFALDRAASEWVLALDADERLSDELRREIEEAFAAGPAVDGFSVARRSFYLGRWMRGGGWYPDRKLRLVRRGRARWAGIDPHDRLEADGRVVPLRGAILHRSYRSLAEHLRKVDFFTGIAAGEKRARGTRFPVARMLVHPPARFLKMAVVRGGWRDGVPGIIAAGMGSLYVFLKYAKLWELERRDRQGAEGPAPAAGSPGGR